MYPHILTGTSLTFVEDRAHLEDTCPTNRSLLRGASACVCLSLLVGATQQASGKDHIKFGTGIVGDGHS